MHINKTIIHGRNKPFYLSPYLNELDFMRRAIAEFIQSHSDNKNNDNRFMFI